MTEVTSKQIPFGQYEYVDVVFGPANTDVIVPYTNLRVDDKNKIYWIDTQQGGTIAGTIATVYRVVNSAATPFGQNYIVVRCNVENYKTRLLLFTERI